MVMTNERIFILDTDLNTLKGLGQFVADFAAVAYQWNIITTSHQDCFGFIISSAIYEEPNRAQYKSDYLTPWIHTDGAASWLMKVRLSKKGKLIKEDPGRNSVLIWYEWPECILEYSPGAMIVSLKPNSFLFLQDGTKCV